MKVAFFGSPEFALPVLDAINGRFEVVLVVAQPDKPAGRGMKSTSPAVARRARDLDLALEQPVRLRGNEPFHGLITELAPDVAVTAAYGKILPQSLLELPPGGFLNVHASLLPRYRGAAPVQWALINGETETGVSIMRTEKGLDTGPVCLVERTGIGESERAPELFERLSRLGAQAVVRALEEFSAGTLDCTPQDDSQATMAPLLEKGDGELVWTRPASELFNRFRGVYAWPGARFEYRGRHIKVHEMLPVEGAGEPGEVLGLTDDGVTVAAGSGAVRLGEVQPPGKPRMAAAAWANGYRVERGSVIA